MSDYPIYDHPIIALREAKCRHDRVRLICFSAHVDMGETGWLTQAVHEELFDGSCSMLLGVRAPTEESIWDRAEKNFAYMMTTGDLITYTPAFPTDVYRISLDEVPTHLHIDVSVLDPIYIPAASRPEWAGMSTHWFKHFLGSQSHQNTNWVGLSIGGFNPVIDPITKISINSMIDLHLANRKE